MNRNFNQLTKTIALSLILAIVSGFGNDSINAQTPNPSPVQSTPQSCPTENLDLNELKTTLNDKYKIFNDSLPGLFTSLRDTATKLDTIKTQDQITKLGSIYQCVLEAQDNANLGAREERIAIRQTITNISNILTPAKDDGFTEETRNTLRTNLNIVEEDGNLTTDLDETIDEIEENLKSLSTQLNSQIQALDNTSKDVPTGNSTNANSEVEDNNTKPPTDSSLFLTRGLLTIVAALAIVVLLLLLRKNQQLNKKSPISELDPDWKQSDEKLNRDIIKLNALYQELINKYQDIQQEVSMLKNQSVSVYAGQSPRTDTIALRTTQANNVSTSDPRPLEQQQNGIGVSETRESFEKRWSGLVAPIVLETASNYNFLIINDRELIPKPGSKVTETKLNTIDGLFEYQNFRSGAPFQVIQPAIVSVIPGDRWQVTQKGILQFI